MSTAIHIKKKLDVIHTEVTFTPKTRSGQESRFARDFKRVKRKKETGDDPFRTQKKTRTTVWAKTFKRKSLQISHVATRKAMYNWRNYCRSSGYERGLESETFFFLLSFFKKM